MRLTAGEDGHAADCDLCRTPRRAVYLNREMTSSSRAAATCWRWRPG